MTSVSRFSAVCAATLTLVVAGCGGSGGDAPPPLDPRDSAGGVSGNLSDTRLTDIPGLGGGDGAAQGGGLTPVNRFLWRASLDTLAFLPLNSTDPFTGVIATDWAASPDAPNERFKVTAYVQSPQLSANALKVAVFREVRAADGGWASAPVSGSTARQLEDAILVRARQLRIGERESQG
ncbi:MAG: DUF3576 domain-containing protein [Pseudomonadota bacterium]